MSAAQYVFGLWWVTGVIWLIDDACRNRSRW